MLPQIAQGDANKVWIIPSEITQALGQLGPAVDRVVGAAQGATPPAPPAPPAAQAAVAPAAQPTTQQPTIPPVPPTDGAA
jgi:hypothetical protein